MAGWTHVYPPSIVITEAMTNEPGSLTQLVLGFVIIAVGLALFTQRHERGRALQQRVGKSPTTTRKPFWLQNTVVYGPIMMAIIGAAIFVRGLWRLL